MVGFQQVKRKTRTANPTAKQKHRKGTGGKAKKRQAPRKQNPDLLTLGALAMNPHKGASMSKQKHKAGKPKPKNKTAPRTGNPQKKKNKPTQKHRTSNGGKKKRTSNPNLTARTMSLLKNGALALAGLVATRQIPQMVLQGKNTSWIGYAANLAVALASAGLAGSFMRGAAAPVLIGGGLYIVDRVLTEQFSSAGQILALSGAGDFKVACNGNKGLRGVRTGYFPLPVQYDMNGNPIIPQAIIDAAQRGMLPAGSPGSASSGATPITAGMKGPGYPNRANGNRLIAA